MMRLNLLVYAVFVFLLGLAGIMQSQAGISIGPDELIFHARKGFTSEAQTVTLTNSGTTAISVTAVEFGGTFASQFDFQSLTFLPATVNAGQTLNIQVVFAPDNNDNDLVSQTASVNVTVDGIAQPFSVPLYALKTKAWEGDNEPFLHYVVQTLGYNFNVGGVALILGTSASAIGDEVLQPLFQKASPGSVTITPVARYSPVLPIPFGYYLPNGSTPDRHLVGTMSGASGQHQTLLPQLASGGTSFDPGIAVFGTWVQGLQDRFTYSEDALNTGGPTLHAVRVYPLKNRQGQLVQNAYYIGYEDASNGDYQDYDFVLTNVEPAGTVSAFPDAASVSEDDGATVIDVRANDPASASTTITALGTSGTKGQVTTNGTTLSYNPNGQFNALKQGQSGSDTFTYTVTGAASATDTAVVTITIQGVNDNPVLSVNNALTVNASDTNIPITPNNLLYSDVDNSASELTYTVTSGPSAGSLSHTTFTQQEIANGTVKYSDGPSAAASDSFTFSLSDGIASVNGTFTIHITPSTSTATPTSSPTPTATHAPGDPETPTPTSTPVISGELPHQPGELGISGGLHGGIVLPEFLWLPLKDENGLPILADWYHVVVSQGNTVLIDLWFPANQVCNGAICGLLTTSALLPLGLLNGDYEWMVQGYTEEDGISDFGAPFAFSINVPAPIEMQSAVVNANQGRPSVVIPRDFGTSWIQIFIGNAFVQHLQWYAMENAECDNSTCELLLDVDFVAGDYQVWFQTWGPAGYYDNDPGFWFGPFDLDLNLPAPELITGLTTSHMPGAVMLHWNTPDHATWYNLWLGRADYSETLFFEWVDASLLTECALDGTCKMRVDVPSATGNTYTWFVRAWGPGGFTSGGEFEGWAKGSSFSP